MGRSDYLSPITPFRLRLRLHQTKFYRIRKQPGDFLFEFKVAVYTEVANPVQKVFGLLTNPENNLDTLNPD